MDLPPTLAGSPERVLTPRRFCPRGAARGGLVTSCRMAPPWPGGTDQGGGDLGLGVGPLVRRSCSMHHNACVRPRDERACPEPDQDLARGDGRGAHLRLGGVQQADHVQRQGLLLRHALAVSTDRLAVQPEGLGPRAVERRQPGADRQPASSVIRRRTRSRRARSAARAMARPGGRGGRPGRGSRTRSRVERGQAHQSSPASSRRPSANIARNARASAAYASSAGLSHPPSSARSRPSRRPRSRHGRPARSSGC